MMRPNATIWFHCRASELKTVTEMTVNTVSEIASWMIFSCIRLKGPPLILLPMLFAGIMKKYSMRATPQLARITRISGQSVEMCISFSFRLPYQAAVMKKLLMMRRITVIIPAFIFRFVISYWL